MLAIDYRRLRDARVVYTLLAGVGALLVLVLFGPELNSTRRWLFFAGVSIQPSELAKLALVPFLAWQIDRRQELINSRELLLPVAVVTGALAGLIVLQPDLGTAVLIAATAGAMLFLAGLAWAAVVAGVPQLYIIIGAVILLGIGILSAVKRTRPKDPPAS